MRQRGMLAGAPRAINPFVLVIGSNASADIPLPFVVPRVRGFLDSVRGVPERGDSYRAIDGNTGSYTYTTPSGTSNRPAYLEIAFSEETTVNRIRIWASDNIGISPYDYEIQYTDDAGSFGSRSY